jgi:hypothetical protein
METPVFIGMGGGISKEVKGRCFARQDSAKWEDWTIAA